jgi:hypothetical protein
MLTFRSSETFDACPFLTGCPYGACSATCAPVSIMGQTIGVVHGIAADGDPPAQQVTLALEQLAVRLGDRLGVLRAFHRSERQATSDPLTALLSRRTLEDSVAALLRSGVGVAVVYGDLDHFKRAQRHLRPRGR